MSFAGDFWRRAPTRDLLELTLFQLKDTKRNIEILNDDDESRRSHVEAARNILHDLRRTCQTALDWTTAHGWPHFQAPQGGFHIRDDDKWIRDVGDRLHYTLRESDLIWPPPYAGPPPAVTRDLLDVYHVALPYRDRFGCTYVNESRLVRAFERVIAITTGLLQEMEEGVGAAGVGDAYAVVGKTTQAVRRSGGRGPNLVTVVLSGLALAISLLQGPGVIHDFPHDVAKLGGDFAVLSNLIATGMTVAAEEIAEAVG